MLVFSILSSAVTLLTGVRRLLRRERHTFKVSSVSKMRKPSQPSNGYFPVRIWNPSPTIQLSTKQSLTATKTTPVRMNVVIDPKTLQLRVLLSASDGTTPEKLPWRVVLMIFPLICIAAIKIALSV